MTDMSRRDLVVGAAAVAAAQAVPAAVLPRMVWVPFEQFDTGAGLLTLVNCYMDEQYLTLQRTDEATRLALFAPWRAQPTDLEISNIGMLMEPPPP